MRRVDPRFVRAGRTKHPGGFDIRFESAELDVGIDRGGALKRCPQMEIELTFARLDIAGLSDAIVGTTAVPGRQLQVRGTPGKLLPLGRREISGTHGAVAIRIGDACVVVEPSTDGRPDASCREGVSIGPQIAGLNGWRRTVHRDSKLRC